MIQGDGGSMQLMIWIEFFWVVDDRYLFLFYTWHISQVCLSEGVVETKIPSSSQALNRQQIKQKTSRTFWESTPDTHILIGYKGKAGLTGDKPGRQTPTVNVQFPLHRSAFSYQHVANVPWPESVWLTCILCEVRSYRKIRNSFI